MSEENKTVPTEMEDIISISPKAAKAAKKGKGPVYRYGKGIFKSLGTIVKAISFLIAFAVHAVYLFAAYLLYSRDPLFASIAIGIVIAGVIISTIIMFLIFGYGHIICQNNEILRRLDEIDYR